MDPASPHTPPRTPRPAHSAPPHHTLQFKLRFKRESTEAIAWNATANQVEAALEALHTIGDVSVSFSASGGKDGDHDHGHACSPRGERHGMIIVPQLQPLPDTLGSITKEDRNDGGASATTGGGVASGDSGGEAFVDEAIVLTYTATIAPRRYRYNPFVTHAGQTHAAGQGFGEGAGHRKGGDDDGTPDAMNGHPKGGGPLNDAGYGDPQGR